MPQENLSSMGYMGIVGFVLALLVPGLLLACKTFYPAAYLSFLERSGVCLQRLGTYRNTVMWGSATFVLLTRACLLPIWPA